MVHFSSNMSVGAVSLFCVKPVFFLLSIHFFIHFAVLLFWKIKRMCKTPENNILRSVHYFMTLGLCQKKRKKNRTCYRSFHKAAVVRENVCGAEEPAEQRDRHFVWNRNGRLTPVTLELVAGWGSLCHNLYLPHSLPAYLLACVLTPTLSASSSAVFRLLAGPPALFLRCQSAYLQFWLIGSCLHVYFCICSGASSVSSPSLQQPFLTHPDPLALRSFSGGAGGAGGPSLPKASAILARSCRMPWLSDIICQLCIEYSALPPNAYLRRDIL